MIRKSHDDFILCILKNKTMIDNPLFENNIIEDSCSLVEEARVRDIDVLLEDLPLLRGASFISQLKEITVHPSFYLVKNENNAIVAIIPSKNIPRSFSLFLVYNFI